MKDKALWLRCGDNGRTIAATQKYPFVSTTGGGRWLLPDGTRLGAAPDLHAVAESARDNRMVEILAEVDAPHRCQARMQVSIFTDRPDPAVKIEAVVGMFVVHHYLDTGRAVTVRRTNHYAGDHADLAFLTGISAPLPEGAAETFAEVLPYLEPLPLLTAAVTAALKGTDR